MPQPGGLQLLIRADQEGIGADPGAFTPRHEGVGDFHAHRRVRRAGPPPSGHCVVGLSSGQSGAVEFPLQSGEGCNFAVTAVTWGDAGLG